MSHGVAGVWFNHGTVNVTRNLIVDNVWAAWGDRSNMTLRDNNMFGNDRGVENGDDSTTIDARYNWWGAANGPSGQGSGDGDPAGDNVVFDPWLDRPVVFNEDPTIRVLEPDGRNDTVDDRFVIRWNATDPDGDAVSVSLYWDGDDVPRGGHLIADGLPAAGSYEWDVSGLEEGEYHVMGIAEDDRGGVGSAYGDGPVTVDHPPSITVLDPPSGDHDADANYTIRWETANASADSTIDIYRDDDTDPSEGLEPVETGLGDNGSYEWDLSSIGEGYYYVYCVVREGDRQAGAYSDGRVHIVHGNGSGGHPPWIEVLEPDGEGDRADRSYTVRWEAGDDDGDTLTIALYYDTDTNPSEGTTLIASGLGNTGSHRWNTTGVDEGEYYIYAIVDDGNGSQATDYSPGTVRVEHGGGPENHPPALEVIEPDGDNDRADRSYTIRWNATDQDGDTIIMSLYYDEDTDAGSGRTLIASGLGNTGSYAWDTSGVPEGAYYIHAIVDDGNGSSTSDYSPGRVTITHPGEGENHDPRVTIERPADRSTVSGTVTVSGRASDEDGNDNIVSVRVRIGDGNWVEAEGTTDWTFSWDTTGWPNGPVTVRVMAEDSEGATGTDRITVTVENPTDPPWIRILSPLDSDTVGGTVVIGGTAGGGADLDWVTVAVDGM
ncbi:MAG TPA: hypothetical protein EYP43_00225, partial [Thermoplasmata archaeon]|nr:hypothetical protein [Thermoplasmata archaeon]